MGIAQACLRFPFAVEFVSICWYLLECLAAATTDIQWFNGEA